MNIRALLHQHPDAFIDAVKTQAGSRLRYVRGTDLEQVFWLGVLEAVPRMKLDDKQMNYLLSAGFGAMRDWIRSEYSRSLTRWCPECKRWIGFRTHHRHEAKIVLREQRFVEHPFTEDVLERLNQESFLNTLSRKERWIADLLIGGFSGKEVARMLGLSNARVSQIKTAISDKLRLWERG